MVDGGRRRGLFGKALCLAMAAVSWGLMLGAASLPAVGATTSSASSGVVGGVAPDSACGGVAERCAADPFCSGCTTAIGGRRKERSRRRLQQQAVDNDADDGSQQQGGEEEVSTELCSSRYPILVTGSSVTFCERVGAAKCCEFSNNDVARSCMEDPLAAEYWGCFLMDEVNCDISDMPCHASHRATDSPTTAPVLVTASPTVSPTPAPTAAPTTTPSAPTIAPSVSATSFPTAGSRGDLNIPTPTPTSVFDAEELFADGVDPDDIDAEGTSGVAARTVGHRGILVLAGVVVVGVGLLSA
eukprot:g5849.t1